MISYDEVMQRSRREKGTDLQTSPINVRLSKRATWLLVNLNVSANQTTVVFFLFAIASAVVFPIGTPTAVVVAAIFYWIHVILDFSDGDIARYNQKFSRNGEFWDHAIHLFTIPLIFAGITLAEIRLDAPDWVAAAGLVLVVSMAFNRGLTDLARTATPSPGLAETADTPTASIAGSSVKSLIRAATWAIGEDKFIVYYTVAVVLSPDGPWRQWVVVGAAIAFLPTVVFKAVGTHRHGSLPRRDQYTL